MPRRVAWPYVRTVKTKSGATAVQIVYSSRRGSREIEHLGSAHDEAGLETLKAAARQRLAAGQLELGLGLEPAGGSPLPITSSRMGHLLDAPEHAYRVLGFENAAGGDEIFRDVLARIIEPVSSWTAFARNSAGFAATLFPGLATNPEKILKGPSVAQPAMSLLTTIAFMVIGEG